MRPVIQTNSKGFTLLELLVAVSIFVTAITIISSQFILFLQSQKRAVEVASTIESARTVVERIARTVRVSVIVSDNTPVTGVGVSELCIYHPRRHYIRYEFDAVNKLVREVPLGLPGDLSDPLNDAVSKCADDGLTYPDNPRITSTDVSVENLHFIVQGVGDLPAYEQPIVTFSMEVKPVNQPNRNSNFIQTTVSQRCLEQHTLCVKS